MAKKTAGATAAPGAGLAPRPRRPRSAVTTGEVGFDEDFAEAERLDVLPHTTLCLADARRRARPR